MNVKSDEERKSKVLKVRLNDKEFAKLKQYTQESGLRSMSEYIFNSILATPIIELTDEELAPEKARFKEIADRINSIAIQVNQTGNIDNVLIYLFDDEAAVLIKLTAIYFNTIGKPDNDYFSQIKKRK